MTTLSLNFFDKYEQRLTMSRTTMSTSMNAF